MMVVLETERLFLRRFTTDDILSMYEILSDSESMKYYPKPFDMEMAKKWINWNLASYEKRGFGLWAVILKSENVFIGDCGITYQNINGKILPEIGYHFNKRYTNKGYATEAARACKKYAFEVLKFDEIYSYMTSENIPSQRVAQKNGMKLVEEYEDNGEKNKVYSITLNEYINQSKL